MPSEADTLIVGAGPAGLAVGAALRMANVPFTILERATRIADSWHGHYSRLQLHTPKAHSALPFRAFPRGYPRYPSRQQVVDYLDDYARAFDLTPELGREVSRCTRGDDGVWTVSTSQREYRAHRVVVTTGNACRPCRPRWPGDDTFPGTVIHSNAYTNGESFRGKRVLVVGFGNSGAEIALDLADHGARCSVSVRSAVNVIPRELFGLPVVTFALLYRPFPARLADKLSAMTVRATVGDLASAGLVKSDVGPMTDIAERRRIPVIDVGTLARMRRGEIVARKGIESFAGREVRFADGTRDEFDAVVLATGYTTGLASMFRDHRSVLDGAERPLTSGRESSVPGLYFCGYNVVSTGMLRQIGIEARAIGKALSR